MDWRHSDGVRWLGWTLLFATLLVLALGILAHDMPGWLSALATLSALSTFVVPLLIGKFFPEDNWRMGPVLSMVIALVVLLAIPATGSPERTGIGLVTKKDEFIFILFWGGWWFFPLLSLLYVGLAVVGTWIGGSRLDQLARQNWDSDADFRNMFRTEKSSAHDAQQ